jgi:hypothetical protein
MHMDGPASVFDDDTRASSQDNEGTINTSEDDDDNSKVKVIT